MNQRFLLALVLTAIVIVVTPLLFPGTRARTTQMPSGVDTLPGSAQPLATPTAPATPEVSALPVSGVRIDSIATPVESVSVRHADAAYIFSTRGATLTSVSLGSYASLRPGGRGSVELVEPGGALARYRLVLDKDTIALDTTALQRTERAGQSAVFVGTVGGKPIEIAYALGADGTDEYLFRVTASLGSAPPGSALLVTLPQTLRSNEADTLDDLNHLAVSYRPTRGEVTSVAFSKLDSNEVLAAPGPITWAATRNKYFLVVYRATAEAPFSGLDFRGAPRTGKAAATMHSTLALPFGNDGTARFEIYAGPQSFERLQALGGDLDQVNPYGGWLQGIVQPFSTMVMKALLWMKSTTQLNYGWVLVLFGIIVRLVLWPLNQGAMRTSLKMQRLQPELQAIQKKYTDDPKRQQEAIMKVYKEHDMSPLSPLMGCLPMLLPMPILFALYYVFQNTIEFRGVSFLWLPDISLYDPYYITPLLMGVSMFVMSWVGMRGMPPNPQAKMMTYMMPVMLTVLFLKFASGLNLYYAVQNVAAIPQQWLLARERANTPAPVPTPASGTVSKRLT